MDKKNYKNKKRINILGIALIILAVFLIVSLELFFGKNKLIKKQTSFSQFDDCYNQWEVKTKNGPYQIAGLMNCYRQAAHNLLALEDLSQILSDLEKQKNDKTFITDCHVIGHFLGNEEYIKTKSIAVSLASCTEYCQGGCYHGVAEEYFKEKYKSGNMSLANLQKDINSICTDKNVSRYIHSSAECGQILGQAQHGLGHALMQLTNYDLNKSLTLCGNMEPCYYGVFMDNQFSRTNGHSQKDLRANDILYPCDAIEAKFQYACYLSLSTSIYKNVSDNLGLCAKFPPQYQELCYLNVDKAHSVNSIDINLFKKDCQNIGSVQIKKWCIEGILFDLLSKYTNNYKLSVDYCNVLDGQYRSDCFNSIFTKNYDPQPDANGTRQICSMLPSDIKLSVCNKLN